MSFKFGLKSVQQFKLLSHQSNSLTAIPLHPREMQNDKVRTVRSQASTQWHRLSYTLWDGIECQMTASTNKHPCLGALIRAQWGCPKVTIAMQYGLLQQNSSSMGGHKGRCANVVVIRGICTEIVRRSFGCNWVFNLLSKCSVKCCESAVHVLWVPWKCCGSAKNCQQELFECNRTPCKLRSNALVAVSWKISGVSCDLMVLRKLNNSLPMQWKCRVPRLGDDLPADLSCDVISNNVTFWHV